MTSFTALLKRLWLWYGIRQGYLDTTEGFQLSSAAADGNADTVTWRGEMVEGACTAMFRSYPSPSILVWNRVLSDAEIGLMREGWKRGVAPIFEGTHGAIMPTPPAMGKADFSTLLHQWIGPNPEDEERGSCIIDAPAKCLRCGTVIHNPTTGKLLNRCGCGGELKTTEQHERNV